MSHGSYLPGFDGNFGFHRDPALRQSRRTTVAQAANRPRSRVRDHFKAVDRDWLLTYENAYGHQIRVAFPPEDEHEARRVVMRAARAMGCTVLDTRGPFPR